MKGTKVYTALDVFRFIYIGYMRYDVKNIYLYNLCNSNVVKVISCASDRSHADLINKCVCV